MVRRSKRAQSGSARVASNKAHPLANQIKYKQPVPSFKPFEIASADEIESLHQASLKVLSKLGINFLLEDARKRLKAAGADVAPDSTRVRFDPEFVELHLKTVPQRFTLHTRNPKHNLHIGDDVLTFCMVGSPPNCSDFEGGRRAGNFKDFKDFVRLAQSLNVCHTLGTYPVEPIDLHPSTRHLDAESFIALNYDKAMSGYSLGRERILDSIEIARLARGIDEETLLKEPSISTIVNANSPLQYDEPMLIGATEMALRNQPVVYTPFTLAGAMAPVTMSGALVQQNAEALAGIIYSQVVNPGAPVIYGTFTTNVDMKSGAPAFGTPEYARSVLISGQLARRYKIPIRSSNTSSSNHSDEQSVYESMMSIWPCVTGHINLIRHGLGWQEGGLCASFEKVILDAEMLQMMHKFCEPMDFSEEALGFEAMADVGPGGHYFGTPHTLERYETAFYSPLLSDLRNFETWQESGSVDARTRAHKIYKDILANWEAPSIDPAVAEAVRNYAERRKSEGGVPTNMG